MCKFPPLPDAICRLDKCLCPVKAEIYFTDPDFKVNSIQSIFHSLQKDRKDGNHNVFFYFMKGFIRICCCEDCTVEYHVTCWKTLKASAFSEKSEKVNLDLVTSSFCVFCCFLVIMKLQFPAVNKPTCFCVAGFAARSLFDSRLHRSDL